MQGRIRVSNPRLRFGAGVRVRVSNPSLGFSTGVAVVARVRGFKTNSELRAVLCMHHL